VRCGVTTAASAAVTPSIWPAAIRSIAARTSPPSSSREHRVSRRLRRWRERWRTRCRFTSIPGFTLPRAQPGLPIEKVHWPRLSAAARLVVVWAREGMRMASGEATRIPSSDDSGFPALAWPSRHRRCCCRGSTSVSSAVAACMQRLTPGTARRNDRSAEPEHAKCARDAHHRSMSAPSCSRQEGGACLR